MGVYAVEAQEVNPPPGQEPIHWRLLTAEEVCTLKAEGYNPHHYYNTNGELREAIARIASGYFSPHDPDLFRPLVDSLMYRDEYLLFADYQSYLDCQERVSQLYRDRENWTRRSILTVARMGKFSADRAIREYCQEIWQVKPVPIELDEYERESVSLKIVKHELNRHEGKQSSA